MVNVLAVDHAPNSKPAEPSVTARTATLYVVAGESATTLIPAMVPGTSLCSSVPGAGTIDTLKATSGPPPVSTGKVQLTRARSACTSPKDTEGTTVAGVGSDVDTIEAVLRAPWAAALEALTRQWYGVLASSPPTHAAPPDSVTSTCSGVASTQAWELCVKHWSGVVVLEDT